MIQIKNHWLLLASIFFVLLTLFPSINMALNKDSYHELSYIIDRFGNFSKNISFLNPPLSYYFTQYGTTYAFNALLYLLFEFNSSSYFILALVLRLTAVTSIYFFVTRSTGSKIAGFIASSFFGVSFPGIQNTIRPTISIIYLAITLMFIYLDRWWDFHSRPNTKNAIRSLVVLVLVILAYPVRMSGVLIMLFIGEIYWYFKSRKDSTTFLLRLKYFSVLLLIFSVLVFGLKTLTKTPELEAKMVSPKILVYALFTGYPPIITTLWLFISNLIVSPMALELKFLKESFLYLMTSISVHTGLIFLLITLFKRRFLLAFVSLSVITFPVLIFNSKPNLTNWDNNWIITTQFGGSIFLWVMIILIFFVWNKYRKLGEIGFLGLVIIIINLIAPWMLSPQASDNDQSAFIFVHRYYTLPAVGMGLFFSSIFTFFLYLVKENLFVNIIRLKQKFNHLAFLKVITFNLVYLFFPMLIILSILLQANMSHDFIIKEGQNINARKIDGFWTKIKPVFDDIQNGEPTKLIYIEHSGNLNEDYVKNLFATRVAIYLGQIQKLPKIKFVFDKDELANMLKDYQNFYAFSFDGENLKDIKGEIKSE